MFCRKKGHNRLQISNNVFFMEAIPLPWLLYKLHVLNVTQHRFILIRIVARTRVLGTAVAQWLWCCATNRKVAGSIPDGVIGIFH